MSQPLRPLGYRLTAALGFGSASFLMIFLSMGRSGSGAVLGLFAAALHGGTWFFGPNAHQQPPKEPPAMETSFPTWVERNQR